MKAVFVIAIFLVVFLYLRFFLKRLRLLLSLRKAAKRAGAKITLTAAAFWFPTNRCKRCELLVRGSDFVYCIKVIGLFQRYCDLHFWNPREYATRKYLLRFQIDQATPLGAKGTRHKRLNIDFSAGLPHGEEKQVVYFYLLSPANYPIHLTKNDGNAIVDIEPGSKIHNIIFTDREYLYQYIALGLHKRVARH